MKRIFDLIKNGTKQRSEENPLLDIRVKVNKRLGSTKDYKIKAQSFSIQLNSSSAHLIPSKSFPSKDSN
jgi:hypothetical protein